AIVRPSGSDAPNRRSNRAPEPDPARPPARASAKLHNRVRFRSGAVGTPPPCPPALGSVRTRRSKWDTRGGRTARAVRPPDGMVMSMATRKVTITLDEGQLDRIRALVESGTTPSVSGFVQHAVGIALDDVAGWGAMLAAALGDTGGELSAEERRWADETLGVKKRRKTSAP